eukprot:11167355-Lingulodinium_polyedra.AAC.1
MTAATSQSRAPAPNASKSTPRSSRSSLKNGERPSVALSRRRRKRQRQEILHAAAVELHAVA